MICRIFRYITLFLSIFSLQGCVETFIMTKENMAIPLKPLVSPDGQPVFADQVSWLFLIGAMKYQIDLDELEKLLDENKERFCGVELKLIPCNTSKEPALSKIIFHGRKFDGQYYIVEGWKDGKKESYIRLAFKGRKLQFLLAYFHSLIDIPPIVYFLPGDEESYMTLEKRVKKSFEAKESNINKEAKKRGEDFFLEGMYEERKASLSRYLIIEEKIFDYLHYYHTREEVIAFCKSLLEGISENKYCLREYGYRKDNPDVVSYDDSGEVFNCFKDKDFTADNILLLYISGKSRSFSTLWESKITMGLSEKLYPSDLVFEAYFRKDRLIAVAMRRVLCPFPTNLGYFGSTYWYKDIVDGEEKVGKWTCKSCYAEKEATYGIMDEIVVFWEIYCQDFN